MRISCCFSIMSESNKQTEPQLAYISSPPQSQKQTTAPDFRAPDDIFHYDKPSGLERIKRKTRENPFVPIGVAVTTFALMFGLYTLRTGNTAMSQKMMRLRVGAQGFTICALIGSLFYATYKRKLAEAEKKV